MGVRRGDKTDISLLEIGTKEQTFLETWRQRFNSD